MSAKSKKPYTRKEQKTIDNWIFHPDYYNESLPKSIQVELAKKIQRSVRMPVEDITEKNPIIEHKIRNMVHAYERSKERSRKYQKRLKDVEIDSDSDIESESESESESEEEGVLPPNGARAHEPAKVQPAKAVAPIDHSEIDEILSSITKMRKIDTHPPELENILSSIRRT
jgi:hypothetical protein